MKILMLDSSTYGEDVIVINQQQAEINARNAAAQPQTEE